MASIKVDPPDLAMTVGDTRQLAATLRDASGSVLTGREVTWESSTSSIATVDGTGLVRALAPGQALIRATSEGMSAQISVEVSAVPFDTIVLTPPHPTIEVGVTQQLTATFLDAAGNVVVGRPVIWSSSDETVATVLATGKVRGISPGIVTITATAGERSGSTSVTVKAPAAVSSVTVSPDLVRLIPGASQALTATLRDEAGNVLVGRSITWASSNEAIASVDAGGAVLAVSQGSATITANAEGKVGSAEVTVSAVTFASVATGGVHTCALTGGGIAYCWGLGESGATTVPVEVPGGIAFTQLAGGGSHTCGLTSDGSAYCWGNNRFGQLGDNSTTSRSTPTPVATGLRFTQIDAGANHTCGVAMVGVAYCWGENRSGQLGDGTTTLRSIPVAVLGNLVVRQIVAGGFANRDTPSSSHTCALTIGGDAYCWGSNAWGQLGTVTPNVVQPEPVPVSGGLNFIALTAALSDHSCGLTAAGEAYCWGANSFGALGDGTNQNSILPVQVAGGLQFSQLSAGGFIGYTCGLTRSGDGYCWGENETGSIGDGTTVDRFVPTAVVGGHRFSSLDSGFRHTCGRTTNGVIYCWGPNGAGQLGNGTKTSSSVPVKVIGQP